MYPDDDLMIPDQMFHRGTEHLDLGLHGGWIRCPWPSGEYRAVGRLPGRRWLVSVVDFWVVLPIKNGDFNGKTHRKMEVYPLVN